MSPWNGPISVGSAKAGTGRISAAIVTSFARAGNVMVTALNYGFFFNYAPSFELLLRFPNHACKHQCPTFVVDSFRYT